ncbi:MAG: putative lipopolysaccharide core biosynthesis glycosyltransferase, partial [Rhodospirillaceae bacterium]
MTLRTLFLLRSLDLGGAERQAVVLCRGLQGRGHTVTVVLFYPGGPLVAELTEAGIPVHSLAKRGRWDLLGPLVRLRELIVRERPDILHGVLPVADILATVVSLTVRAFRPKLVFGVRASDLGMSHHDMISRLSYKIEAWLGGRADLVIANAEAGLRAVWARGLASSRGLVIPNGIDTDRF